MGSPVMSETSNNSSAPTEHPKTFRRIFEVLEQAYMGDVAPDSPLGRKMKAQMEAYFSETNPFSEGGAGAAEAVQFLVEDESVRLLSEEIRRESPQDGQMPNLYRAVQGAMARRQSERAEEA